MLKWVNVIYIPIFNNCEWIQCCQTAFCLIDSWQLFTAVIYQSLARAAYLSRLKVCRKCSNALPFWLLYIPFFLIFALTMKLIKMITISLQRLKTGNLPFTLIYRGGLYFGIICVPCGMLPAYTCSWALQFPSVANVGIGTLKLCSVYLSRYP